MMNKKNKSTFFCTNCGENFPKWHGRCLSCGTWDSISEFRQTKKNGLSSWTSSNRIGEVLEPVKLSSCKPEKTLRIETGFPEVDRVLGGGLVPGSVILVGGSPGIGKSTLMLHNAANFTRNNRSVLYVTGEESIEQLSLRSQRLGIGEIPLDILTETGIERIIPVMEQMKPEIVIIDSIQTAYSEQIESASGSISQVRECAGMFIKHAKGSRTALFLIGHVTKEGTLAGPRVLEHMVDTVLYFEGDSSYQYRILRVIKNRFGSTGEIALFAMTDKGLDEIKNASEFFLMHRDSPQVGTSIVPVREGSRVLVVELQALVSPSHFGLPQRVASGINQKKLAIVLAVLERYAGLSLGDQDIFFNITGGLNLSEPAIDLGIAAAILSSFRNIPIPMGMALLGELGLGGEVRPVNNMATRLKELAKMGFDKCVVAVPKPGNDWETSQNDITLIKCRTISDLADHLF